MFLSELFSFKSRGIVNGVTVAMNYIFSAIANKSYYNLETALSLPGISTLFACIAFIGLIVAYTILPETENRSLDDIEVHFADNFKSLTDREIAISKHQAKKMHDENGNRNQNVI